MVYDAARQRIVLDSGLVGFRQPVGDLWEWDGVNWTLIANGRPRSGHALAYEAPRSRVLFVGGIIGVARWSDTWAWDGTTWKAIAGGDGGFLMCHRPGFGRMWLNTRRRPPAPGYRAGGRRVFRERGCCARVGFGAKPRLSLKCRNTSRTPTGGVAGGSHPLRRA